MINLYWAVYKNLEKEIIELSYNIYFDDNQFDYVVDDKNNIIKTPPYSLKAGDLLCLFFPCSCILLFLIPPFLLRPSSLHLSTPHTFFFSFAT